MGTMKVKTQTLILFMSMMLLTSCGTTSKSQIGNVRNFSGLDGCSLLIEMKDGSFLQPFEMTPDFKLMEDQKIKFSYEQIEGVASTCMKGKIVRITKIKAVD
jgi:hypothetical protein